MSDITKAVLKIVVISLVVVGFVGALLGLTIAGEVPTGSVTGRVLDENGKPLAGARVAISNESGSRRGLSNEQGVYVITDVSAEQSYHGYAAARGYETAGLMLGAKIRVNEGKTTRIDSIKLAPRPPQIYGSMPRSYMPGEQVKLSLNGYSRQPIAKLHITVYRFDFARRVRELNGETEPYDDSLSRWKNIGAPVAELDRESHTDNEGYFTAEIQLPVKELGGYLAHVRLETTEGLFKTLITDLALVAKRGPGKALIYATSFKDKKPVPGAKLEFFTSKGKISSVGETDENGLFVTTDLPTDSVTILGSHGQSYALNQTYTIDEDETHRCYIYTDRPVYRPGHKVYFRGILRKSLPGKLVPVIGEVIPVQVKDDEGNKVASFDLLTDGYGAFHGQYDLDTDATSGYYSVIATVAGEEYEGSFKVEEYRKPEFKTAVSFAKPSYVGGRKIKATIEASYYFGAPVAGAKVTYTVYKSPSYFHYYPEEDVESTFYETFFREQELNEEEGYYGGYGDVVLESEGITDENGVLKIDVPTRKSRESERYEIEASVMDPSGRSVDASGGVLVTPGLYTFSLDTDRYVYKPGDRVKAKLYSVNYQRKRIPNVSADVTVYEEKPHNQRDKVTTRTIKFNDRGEADFEFFPKRNGGYAIRVSAKDKLGNAVSGQAWVWVASDDWAGGDYEPEALQLTLDKKIYQPGDTARVILSSPQKDCYVLFTIEGRRLFDYRLIHLTTPSKVIEVPISQDFSPNAFVCATMVKGAKLAEAREAIGISPAPNFLTVKLSTDKPRYKPGETATYTVRTIGADGNPVSAQVALGVVDESLYAIREDMTPNIRSFFHGPTWNHVSTSFSFSREYYGGEDKFQGRVRKYFPDTAYWNPSVITDENGSATVSFKMPDNLTAWRATARAVTPDTRVGGTTNRVVVTKDLLVRLQMPRFFRQRDKLALSAVVHNYTDREQRVRVWLDVTGIKVGNTAARTIKHGPNGAGRIEWPASVPHPGTAKLTVYAQGQGDQDAMEMEAPILAHGVEERRVTSGETTTSKSFTLTAAGDIIRSASTLEIGVSPGIAGAALGITSALGDYDYSSAEGIMDVLLPNVVMYQAMRQLGHASPDQLAKIQKLVKHDLRLVYEWQLFDGGWGWGEYGQKDAWMTAYVCYGLIRARQAGIPIKEDVLSKGLDATVKSLPDHGDLGKKSTMVYVLALAGKAQRRWVDEILRDKKLQNYSCALMILSLAEMGDMRAARALVPKLEEGAKETQMRCYWPEIFPWGFYSCNQYETTAYAIRALLAVDPQNPRIAKGIRWLVTSRKGDRYSANYDTASVVYALADYMLVHKPVTPDYSSRVVVNGKTVRDLRMTAESIYQPEVKIKVRADGLKPGANVIDIGKTGLGDLFYWAVLKYYPSTENIPAVATDKISVARSYYRLELVRDPKEGLVYKPRPLGGFARVGELVRCKLTIKAPKDFRYVKVDDMLPSGCEVVRKSDSYGWDYWWSGEVVHDDRVSFMLSTVYEGKREIEYDFRPEIRGRFHVMPAVAQGAFEPEIYAHSAETRLTVR